MCIFLSAIQGPEQCHHLFQLGAFHKLLVFLLGADKVGPTPLSPITATPREFFSKQTPPSGQKPLAIPLPAPSPTSTLQRRWSQAQAKDFNDLHATLATMILNCNLETQSPGKCTQNEPGTFSAPAEVHAALFGQSAPFYLQVSIVRQLHYPHMGTKQSLSFKGIGRGMLSRKQHKRNFAISPDAIVHRQRELGFFAISFARGFGKKKWHVFSL